MRALLAAAKARAKPSATSGDALIPQEVPKFERLKSNFSRSNSVVSQTSLRTPSACASLQAGPAAASASSPGDVTETPKPVPLLAAATPAPAPAPAPAAAPAPAPAPPAGGVTEAKATAVDGEKKMMREKMRQKKDGDEDKDLPDRIVLNCKRSGMPPIKIELDHGLQAQVLKSTLFRAFV